MMSAFAVSPYDEIITATSTALSSQLALKTPSRSVKILTKERLEVEEQDQTVETPINELTGIISCPFIQLINGQNVLSVRLIDAKLKQWIHVADPTADDPQSVKRQTLEREIDGWVGNYTISPKLELAGSQEYRLSLGLVQDGFILPTTVSTSALLDLETKDTINLLLMEYLLQVPETLCTVKVPEGSSCHLQIHPSGTDAEFILVIAVKGGSGDGPRLDGIYPLMGSMDQFKEYPNIIPCGMVLYKYNKCLSPIQSHLYKEFTNISDAALDLFSEEWLRDTPWPSYYIRVRPWKAKKPKEWNVVRASVRRRVLHEEMTHTSGGGNLPEREFFGFTIRRWYSAIIKRSINVQWETGKAISISIGQAVVLKEKTEEQPPALSLRSKTTSTRKRVAARFKADWIVNCEQSDAWRIERRGCTEATKVTTDVSVRDAQSSLQDVLRKAYVRDDNSEWKKGVHLRFEGIRAVKHSLVDIDAAGNVQLSYGLMLESSQSLKDCKAAVAGHKELRNFVAANRLPEYVTVL